MPSTVQFDIFGGSVVIGPVQVFALEPAETECRNRYCGNTQIPRIAGIVTRRVTAYEFERMSITERCGFERCEWVSNRYVRDETLWITCDDCEFVCDTCDEVCDRYSGSQCSRCDSCESCCECYWCESCEEPTDENYACSDCYYCRDCCNCRECGSCGSRYRGDDECCGYDECDASPIDPADIDIPIMYCEGLSTIGRTFGVELETVGIHADTAVAALRFAGLSCAGFLGYTHSRTDQWKVVTDSSVYGGYEIVSPILRGDDGFHQLQVAMMALRANGGNVDARCGTHVHHGMPDATGSELAKVAKFYDRHHSLIDQLHPRSRRGNAEWSGPNYGLTVDNVEKCDNAQSAKSAAMQCQRYSSVNLTAFAKYETVEFRQHAGTLDYDKLSAWIRFGQSLIMAAICDESGIHDSLSNLLEGLTVYGLTSSTVDYLSNRASELASA